MKTKSVKIWEIVLGIVLIAALLAASGLGGMRSELSDKLIRLRVVANSDSEHDQSVKLRVRDAVISELSPLLKNASGRGEAEKIIRGELKSIAETSARVSGAPASVTLRDEDFPTRDYDGFALPAGEYRALTVTLGAGEGHNWWCVVFPPLCTSAAELNAEEAALLTEEEIKLITGDGEGYILRFKAIELFERLKLWLAG